MTQRLPTAELGALADPDAFRRRVMTAARPMLLPGAAGHWPFLEAGAPDEPVASLRRFDAGLGAEMFVGGKETNGRYYYDESLSGFNFRRESVTVGQALERIVANAGSANETAYLGSLEAESFFPGLVDLARLAFVPPSVLPRIWVGNASRVACHYDMMDNVACVAAGRRRFTLYPPEAIGDLYVGPIDLTMAGQPVGLAVDSAPGDPRYPRFEAIRDRALVAELAAGDAIYIPKLWWHQVEALAPVNVLVNFWWDGFAAGPDKPFAAMLLALVSIAERPPAERAAWRAWFDHYVFRPDRHPLEHLPPEQRGILGPLGEGNYQHLRMIAMRMLRGG